MEDSGVGLNQTEHEYENESLGYISAEWTDVTCPPDSDDESEDEGDDRMSLFNDNSAVTTEAEMEKTRPQLEAKVRDWLERRVCFRTLELGGDIPLAWRRKIMWWDEA